MPLPSSHLRIPSRTPPFSPIRDREHPGNVRDRLAERERDRGPLPYDRNLHSRDGSRGRVRGGDWTKDRDRGDRDRTNDRDRDRQRERGVGDRNNEPRGRERPSEGERGRERPSEPERGREQTRESEKERERDRERRARMRAREADREPGEITNSSRMEDGELGSRDSRGSPTNSARQVVADSVNSDSPHKKRKITPIVWDLDDSKTGPQASTSQAAPHPSTRFGPNSSPRSQQRSSSSSSPSTFLKPSSRPSTVSPSGQVTEQVRLRGKATVSPSPAGREVDRKLGGKQETSPGLSDRAVEINRSSERMSTSPREPSSRGIDSSEVGVDVSGSDIAMPSIPQQNDSPSSSLSSSGDERGSPTAIQSGDVHMQDVEMVTGTPDSEEVLEPGQVLDSPMLFNKQEDGTPALVTIARSRWAEDTTTPEHNVSPPLRGSKARSQRSRSIDSEEQGKASSTSPEPGEFRNNTGKGSLDGEEYERELNKKELQELDEDSGSEDREVQQPELDSEPEEENSTVGVPQHRAIDMLQGCRSVDEFEKLNKIDEGTYGVVFRARDKKTGELVALKKVKMEKEKGGFPMTSLREINVLLSFHHPSIVDVKEVVVGNSLDNIFMVMEYMEHDLKGLMESMKQPFSQSEVKCLMLQLFDGVKYLHDNWVLHRDLKTSNLLLNNRGELKICDLGLARQYGDPLKEYTHEVVTLWYRAPELLLGARKYSTPIDMWSLGCIMAEFLAKEPLFPGKSPIDEIDKIFKTLGTPNEKIWPDFVKLPGVRCNFTKQPFNRLREKFPATAFAGRPTLSEKGFDLLNRLLTYDPSKRITADEALNHEWFREVPLPKAKEFMPTFPARSENDRRIRRLMKSPDPLEEQRLRELKRGELGGGGLFG